MINFLNPFRRSAERRRDVKINILTRTSGRPNGFKICHESIKKQTYPNINHIVSYDSDKDLDYLNKFDVMKFKVDREYIVESDCSTNPGTGPFSPHNLYCNVLLSHVKEGWIMFLDDDDMLAHKKVIEQLVSHISKEKNNEVLFLWQMRYPNGKLLPSKKLVRQKIIKRNHIGNCCFLFHSQYATLAMWDAWKCADYRYIKVLYEYIPKKKWIPKPFVLLNNFGDWGQKNDIENSF